MHSRANPPLPHQSVPRVVPTLSRLSMLAVGIAAGAAAMFFFDSVSGGRRRALVRDKIAGTGHDAAYVTRTRAKRATDHLKGLLVTRRLDRVTRAMPENDQQLHDRIRARLGRVVSHPKSVHVGVNGGRVTLTGHILSKEVDQVLEEVKHHAGVTAVDNQLIRHASAEHIPELQGRTEPRGREQRREVVS